MFNAIYTTYLHRHHIMMIMRINNDYNYSNYFIGVSVALAEDIC